MHNGDRRPYYPGKLIQLPGRTPLVTQEGVSVLDQAVAVLRATRALSALAVSPGMSRAARDHVRDTGPRGATGHTGRDGSTFTARLSRYGQWVGRVGGNISYGAETAREVLLPFLIDDGVKSRGHRQTLLAPAWHLLGVACGAHAQYGIGDSRPKITLHRRPNAIAWRWYLTCPDCHTLRTALYVPGDDARLSCRLCANLTYHSIRQRRTTGEKLRRALKTLMAPAKRRKSS